MQHIAGLLLLSYESEKNCVSKRCCFHFSHPALNQKSDQMLQRKFMSQDHLACQCFSDGFRCIEPEAS